MRSLEISLDDDLYNFLEFLERTRFIKNKEEAIQKAMIFFKKLSIHDWLPDFYRIGNNRMLFMDRGMLLDIFELLTDNETYRAGQLTAMKRKVMKPEYRDINFQKQANWLIVLKELENFGWGKFSKVNNEIKIESSAVPTNYLKGYLETMFKVEFEEHQTKIEGLTIFLVKEQKVETWR